MKPNKWMRQPTKQGRNGEDKNGDKIKPELMQQKHEITNTQAAKEWAKAILSKKTK